MLLLSEVEFCDIVDPLVKLVARIQFFVVLDDSGDAGGLDGAGSRSLSLSRSLSRLFVLARARVVSLVFRVHCSRVQESCVWVC